MSDSARDLSWPDIQKYLRIVHERAPELVKNGILIGGAACIYHRFRFEKAQNQEFQLRSYSDEEEQMWMSKDVDFAILPDMDFPDVTGLRVGRSQFGFRVGPEMFDENAKPATFKYSDGITLSVKIADSLDLYREKEACVARRNQAHDWLHVEMLREVVTYQICVALDFLKTGKNEDPRYAESTAFIERAESDCRELFADQRVKKRLQGRT